MDGYVHYDLQDEDPYLIEGSTCLKNLLGITNTAELNEAEAAISAAAMAELIARPVAPTFSLKHLCEIHSRRAEYLVLYLKAGDWRRQKGGVIPLRGTTPL